MIRIITDSAADFEHSESERLGISTVPLAVFIEGKEYKDEFDSKKLDSFKQSEAQILEDMQLLKTYLLPLLSLTEEFMPRFMEEKQKRKMLEFSDISHMA